MDASALKRCFHQPVAEDYQVRAAKAVIAGLEVAADRRRHAEHAEIAGTYALAVEALRLRLSGHRRLPRLEHRDRLKRMTARGHLAIGVESDLRALSLIDVPDHHDAFGLRIGQGLEHDRIQSAEHRCTRSQAERQDHHRSHGEAGSFAQLPQRITQVAKPGADEVFPAVVVHLLADHSGIA